MRERSMLPDLDVPGERASELIGRALEAFLQPGEEVLAYADRGLQVEDTDAFFYHPGGPPREIDALAYPEKPSNPEIDAFAYDTAEGRRQPDVLGYERGRPQHDTDAYAYRRPVPNPETNAFISEAAGPRAADVDFLILTDRRLIRGLLENESPELLDVACDCGQLHVALSSVDETAGPGGEPTRSSYLSITLPPVLRREGEDQWCWSPPEGQDPAEVAKDWQ
jgi:hypothetical protein